MQVPEVQIKKSPAPQSAGFFVRYEPTRGHGQSSSAEVPTHQPRSTSSRDIGRPAHDTRRSAEPKMTTRRSEHASNTGVSIDITA